MNQAESGTVVHNATNRIRTAVVVSIMSVIALVHIFRVGTYLPGSLVPLYYSYFSDIVVPFGVYFLLCLPTMRSRLLENWHVRALLVFLAAATAEIMQGFGVPLLGRTFDPLDFVMCAVGVLLAVVVDRLVLARLLSSWSPRDRIDAVRSKTL